MNNQIIIQLGLSVLSLVIYLAVLSLSKSAISSFGRKQKINEKRIVYINKFVSASLFILLFIIVIIIWGIDVRGILIFASSFFAVVGIALFASWSILSNITSGVIMFFSFPYKIGDSIRIVDGDNSIEGVIADMTLFYIKIDDNNGNTVLYPNNVAMQKPIIKLKSP